MAYFSVVCQSKKSVVYEKFMNPNKLCYTDTSSIPFKSSQWQIVIDLFPNDAIAALPQWLALFSQLVSIFYYDKKQFYDYKYYSSN